MHPQNSYVTLTYDNEHLPSDQGLLPNDITKCFKTLRNWGFEFSYFQAGEYGEKYLRPHHHVIFMGISFDHDRVFTRTRSHRPIWVSPTLRKAWPYGNHEIEETNFAAGCYVAQYTAKKISNQPLDRVDADGVTWEVRPPYISMSKGIGTTWFQKYHDDVYPQDFIVFGDGQITRPPKFYDDLYKIMDPKGFQAVKDRRAAYSEAKEPVSYLQQANRHYISQSRVDAKIREPDENP